MTWFELLLLALIQGLTEFLPVSSSAHLILPAHLWGGADQGVWIDLMAHVGTLCAVLVYFRTEILRMGRACLSFGRTVDRTDFHLALIVMISAVPVLGGGAWIALSGYEALLRKPWIIVFTTIVFGIVLWVSDVWGRRDRPLMQIGYVQAGLLGLAQMLALIPGTSRSGITITMARFLGLARVDATRLSMLMSIPVIGAGGGYALLKLSMQSQTSPETGAGLVAGLCVATLAFGFAYATIALFMAYVQRMGFFPFMLYRVILGLGLWLWLV